MSPTGPAQRKANWLSNGDRLRSGWRILLYFVLFFALAIVGQVTASLLPRGTLTWAALLLSTAAALVAGVIMLTRMEGRPAGALGFGLHRAAPAETGWGFVFGTALIALTVALLLVTGSAHFVSDDGTASEYAVLLIRTLVFFWIAAALEELLFRGYPFQVLVEGIGVWPAVAVSSVLFSVLHGWNPNVSLLALANIFLAGVMLAVAYLRTRSLWFATAVHVGWNWSMASLFDFPVSGLTGFETPLYDVVPTGQSWWTGGAFGPEAGLAGTLVLLAGTVWLVRTTRLSVPQEVSRMQPIVDRRLGTAGP